MILHVTRTVTCGLTALMLLAASAGHGAEYGTCEEAMKAGEEGLFMWRVEESAQAYEAALRLAATDRERTQARLGQGNALYFAGRYDEARAVYAEVLNTPRLHRDDAFFANQYTGHCYLQQQEFARALAAYRRGLDSRPSLRQNVVNDIYFAGMDAVNLGRRLYRLGRHDEACQALGKALGLENLQLPEQIAAWIILGDCWLVQDRPDRAQSCYRNALELKPLAPDLWLRSTALAGIARSLRKFEDAETLRRAWLNVWNMDGAHPNLRAESADRLRRLGAKALEDGWELDTQYGAECNPTGSPIGGGKGYARIATSGDYEVGTLAELDDVLTKVAAMSPAQRNGVVIYVKPQAQINLAGRNSFRVPSGATLAGNRGWNDSPGPLFFTDEPLTGYALFFVESGARMTGLRIRGDADPFSKLFGMWPESYWPPDYFTTEGRTKPSVVAAACTDDSVVDNCEISCFQTALSVAGADVHIHHNYLHDVHAYPIVVQRGAPYSLIEGNIIDWAWHGVATADDMMASFVLRYNIFREAAPNLWGQGISGQFAVDHHGRGGWFVVHHNTFLHLDRTKGVPNRSVALTPPWDIARIHNNWFRDYMTADEAVMWVQQKPYEPLKTLKEIVMRRDLSRHVVEYLDGIENYGAFDMREMVVTTRAGTGGQNMWIYDNAYGPEKDVLERSLFTTPRIAFIHPAHRQVRTIAARGRGGSTNAVLQHLRGEVAIDIAVEVLNGLELKKVTMDLIIPNVANLRSARTSYVKYRYVPGPDETQRLYEGPAAPEPGAVVLDTRKFPNGLYGLMVTAEDNRGIRCDQNTFFGIVNRGHESRGVTSWHSAARGRPAFGRVQKRASESPRRLATISPEG